MLQKFIPVANLPMVRGGARNLLDGSKCASIGHILPVYRANMESRSGYAFEHCRDYVLERAIYLGYIQIVDGKAVINLRELKTFIYSLMLKLSSTLRKV